MKAQQLPFDFTKSPLNYKKGQLKEMAQRIVASTVKRINKEENLEKKYKLKIIKTEFHKLADEL